MPLKMPKFVLAKYDGEVHPFEIIKEKSRILKGVFYRRLSERSETSGYVPEGQNLWIKKKHFQGNLKVTAIKMEGTSKRKRQVHYFELV